MTNAAVLSTLIGPDDRFLVTGATGWLGRTALELLERALGSERFRRDVAAFAGRPRPIALRTGTTIDAAPLADLAASASPTAHVLHFAFLTKDRESAGDAYLAANLGITAAVLEAMQRGCRSVIYASSGAVYAPGNAPGALETSLSTNPYGALKHIDELAFRAAAVDAGARCVIARVFALGGAYMTKPHLYALGDLIAQARAGEAIVIRAPHRVVRSIARAQDVTAVALAAALDPGEHATVFESGGAIVEIGELVAVIQDVLGTALPVERPPLHDTDAHIYAGDPAQMERLAARYGLVLADLATTVRETAEWLGRTRDS